MKIKDLQFQFEIIFTFLHEAWQVWMAPLKKSSMRRLSRLGFLSKASLMLPRKRDLIIIEKI